MAGILAFLLGFTLMGMLHPILQALF